MCARSLIYTVKFGRQFGFESAAAAVADLSLILLRFLFIYARAKRVGTSGGNEWQRDVIAWRHLHHRSKLSAVNDSFSHIAFLITTHKHTYTYILYYKVVHIYTSGRRHSTLLNDGRHLLRIGEFYICGYRLLSTFYICDTRIYERDGRCRITRTQINHQTRVLQFL